METSNSKHPTPLPPEGDLLQYGGQAVIEGVMMRSPRYFAVACRRPDGEIVIQREPVDKSALRKFRWMNRPFLRGTLALLDAMILGTRALAFASNVQLQTGPAVSPALPASGSAQEKVREEVRDVSAPFVNGPPVTAATEMPASGKINDIAIKGTMLTSFVFGLGLFVLLPTLLTEVSKRIGWTAHASDSKLNVVDGLIRMVIFFGYITLISAFPAIRAVFQYHGAEHKAINTLEAGLPLTRENALRASRIHPRCGTSFIFIVLVINLLVFTILPRPPAIYLRFPLHIAVIPIVAGLAYEIIKFAGKYRRYPLVMAIFAPGMWSQYLTTREPTPEQVDVSLASLYSVLEAEGHLAPQQSAEVRGDVPERDAPEAAVA